MNNDSLKFRVFKAIMALPVPVCIIIPSILWYYAYVRNPMITGIVLILASEALMLSSWAIGIWAVVFLIINMFYFPLSEEPGLRKRFGKEYEEYCKNVPRYIPRLTPWKAHQE